VADDQQVELARIFADIARTLLAEPNPQSTLERIVGLAVAIIDGCEHASITVIHGRIVSSPAASDATPAALERLQSLTGEGPCLDAIRQREVFQTGHLSQERRWPNFASRAYSQFRIESIVAFRLFAQQATLGALNLYSTQPDAFDEHEVAVGSVFATHAAVALSSSQEILHLSDALGTRALIGQAVGMLMAREHVSEDRAFNMLVRASQRLNTKLRLVAEDLVHPQPNKADHRHDQGPKEGLSG
jgi:transcriptional regulator with GAF, ATPase, and Fis domain